MHIRRAAVLLSLLFVGPLSAEDSPPAGGLRTLDAKTLGVPQTEASAMLGRALREQIHGANDRESAAWKQVRDRVGWEQFSTPRVNALRAAVLANWPEPPRDLHVRVAHTREGDGCRIDCLSFESRPGVVVTANLYRPVRPGPAMPGILLCHSHHAPKEQGELQDMGQTWARLGCLVLVIELPGHGERRQHPFRAAADYPKSFRVSRQDYYFRYNLGMQLSLVGDSLMGWIVWDLMRGVDLLLRQPGIDSRRIVLLGAVAGGGDPAAVAGALDPRITAVGPFNFGGPQPESAFPLPPDAETTFNYAGSGSWESTRNLRRSASDGFLPWVIVGSVAPRRLIYGHEFSWDLQRDPVWRRLQDIHGFYETPTHLASAIGKGRLSGSPPESSHCTNIGPLHRQGIYAALKRWFDMEVPAKDLPTRLPAEALHVRTSADPALPPLHVVAGRLAGERLAAARKTRDRVAPDAARQGLREDWDRLLGGTRPVATARAESGKSERLGEVAVERVTLTTEPGIRVPTLLLLPRQPKAVVLAVCQEGKAVLLRQRAEPFARLLADGVAVCLPDLRGTGETRPSSGRGRSSAATSHSATAQMLGQTVLGGRLRDLRAVVDYLQTRDDLRGKPVGLWGDSFAPPLPADRNPATPLDADDLPVPSEPLGGLLAVLTPLLDQRIVAAHGRGGLVSFASLLESPFVHVPHDAVIPGALTVADLPDLAAALPGGMLWLSDLVDGQNRPAKDVASRYGRGVRVTPTADAGEAAAWLGKQLTAGGQP